MASGAPKDAPVVPPLLALGRFAAELRWEDVPEATRELARLQLGEVLASYATGFAVEDVRRIAAAHGVRPADDALLPERPAGPPDPLVAALCAASMAHDHDDFLFMGHTGHGSVACALALGPCDGEELLTRIVIGNEVGGRLGASAFFGPHNGQMWSYVHLASAAVLQARVLGLDGEGIAHALAIAFAQPPWPLAAAFMGAPTKLLTALTPALQGLAAARLAAAGLRGNLELLEAPGGFWESFTFVPMASLVSGLGRTWLTDTLSFKRHPGCAYLGPILDALDAMRREAPIDPRAVERVEIDATFLTVEMDELARPHRERRAALDPVLVNFSVADTVALDLLAGGMRCADLHASSLAARRDEARALAARVVLRHDWRLSVDLVRSVSRTLPLERLLGSLSMEQLREIRTQARRHHGKSLDLGLTALRRILRGLESGEARSIASFLGKKALGQGPTAAPLDLGEVELLTFELPVGARVTLVEVGGKRRQAAVRRPAGTPQTDRKGVVTEKLARDVGAKLGAARAERIARLLDGMPRRWDELAAELGMAAAVPTVGRVALEVAP